MAKRRLRMLWSMALALAMLLAVSCKKEGVERSESGDASSSAVESGGQEPGFTRAEIRRESPLEIDTVGLAKAAPKDTVAVATGPVKPAAAPMAPAKPVAAPKAEPPAVAALPTPAAKVDVAPASGSSVVPNETGEWVLQVNVHKSEAEAKAQIAKLGQVGIPGYAVPVPTGDANLSGNYWRVRVGRFTTRADAQTYGKSVLEPKGLKFWVDRKSNESRQGT